MDMEVAVVAASEGPTESLAQESKLTEEDVAGPSCSASATRASIECAEAELVQLPTWTSERDVRIEPGKLPLPSKAAAPAQLDIEPLDC